MPKKMEIKFEKGGTFTAELLESEAPETTKTIWNRLPMELEFYHSMVSGEALVTFLKDLTVEPENQMVAGILPGALAFLVRDPPRVRIPDEIYIAYGIFVSRGLTVNNYLPVNVFAYIKEDLEHLKEVGQRIFRKGGEKVTFVKK